MEKGRILIAEDDIFSFGVFKNYLVQSVYQAKNFKNGREALSTLRNETFDVVVLDLELPSINGIKKTSTQQIIASPLFSIKKKTSVTPPFPIVVIATSTGGKYLKNF